MRVQATSTRTISNYLSVGDDLEGERRSEVRDEYIGDEVYGMDGASDRHNVTAGNLFAALIVPQLG